MKAKVNVLASPIPT